MFPIRAVVALTQPYRYCVFNRYGVQGIPSLLILDTVSGAVVVNASQSRNEVMMACQAGDQAIEAMFESWLQRVPPDTIELISMLEVSCRFDENENKTKDKNEPTAAAQQAQPQPQQHHQRTTKQDDTNIDWDVTRYMGVSCRREVNSGGAATQFWIGEDRHRLTDVQILRKDDTIRAIRCTFNDNSVRTVRLSDDRDRATDNPDEGNSALWESVLTKGTTDPTGSVNNIQCRIQWGPSDVLKSFYIDESGGSGGDEPTGRASVESNDEGPVLTIECGKMNSMNGLYGAQHGEDLPVRKQALTTVT